MNTVEIAEFQRRQRIVVAQIGAFLSCLGKFSEFLSSSTNEDNEIKEVRKLQQIVGEFWVSRKNIQEFLNDYHYRAYSGPILSMANGISDIITTQTLPSKRVEVSELKHQIDERYNIISEAMIAIAQITPSSVDANFVAGNSFSAFCFLYSVISSSSELIIIDPYIDKTIFYRYFSDLNKNIPITIVSDKSKLKGTSLAEFESVEELFKKEYKNYKRLMRRNLHDRYLINEINGYILGGSIAHAAYNADYSITEISREKRDELIKIYT